MDGWPVPIRMLRSSTPREMRLLREGHTKQQIQYRVGWTLDTDMWERYVHLTAEDTNEHIYAEAGVVEESDATSTTRERCGNCREVVPPYQQYCGTCGEPATAEARELRFEAESDVVDDIAAADQAVDRRLLRKAYDLIKENPQMLEAE